MNKKKTILSCLLLFLLSCSNKDIEQEFEYPLITLSREELKVLSIRGTKTTKEFNEIESDIQFVISFLDKDATTKSPQKRTVSNIKVLTSESGNPATRSFNANDTLIYAVNFEDNMGAALICADKRVNEPILAFFPKGSILESNDNPGLSIFLANVEADILNSIKDFENKKDSIYLEILSKYGNNNKLTRSYSIDDNYDYEGKVEIHTITKRGPLVYSGGIAPLVNAKWSQSSPFNENVKYKGCSNGVAPAGCGPIAIAQIMSYWKYPTTFHGVNFDWNNINNYSTPFQMSQAPIDVRQNVAKLIEEVAKSLETKYSCSEGSTNTKQYEKILRESGFKFNSKQKYNSTTVHKSLSEKKPLLIRGSSGRKKFLGITYKYTGGHIWIIDGNLTMSETYEYTVTRVSETDGAIVSRYNGTSTTTHPYLHINWGWGGYNNGYYSSSYFNSNNKPTYDSNFLTRNVGEDDIFDGESDSNFEEGTSGNFVYDIEIIPFISK